MVPRISIVVTVKNEERYISNLLNSIAKLDYPRDNLETIVVDGGSTDGTLSIISQYPWVKLFKEHCGISEGRNIGIKNSSGEIIAFTDGDCILPNDWLNKIVKYLEEYPKIVGVGGPYLPNSEKGIIEKYFAFWTNNWFPKKTETLRSPQKLGTGNVAYRKRILEQLGGFDQRLSIGEDIDLNSRILMSGYELLYAEDVEVYHNFRKGFVSAFSDAFRKGAAASKYYGVSIMLRGRNFLFILGSLSFLLLLAFTVLYGSSLVLWSIPTMLFFYYLFKFGHLKSVSAMSEADNMSKLTIPAIDMALIFFWFLGSVSGLFSNFQKSKVMMEPLVNAPAKDIFHAEQESETETLRPFVSIVVTVKNEEEYISDLLDSISALDYPKDRVETIVVDGGSSDRTVDIISRYSWVKLIVTGCTHSEGLNMGIRNAKGSIIACTDGDCIVDKDWLKSIVKYFERNQEIVAVGGPYLPSNQKEICAQCFSVLTQSWFPWETGFTDNPNKLGTGNIAFRRILFDELGMFDESIGMGTLIKSGDDIDFNLRIVNSGHILFYAKDVKVYHRFRRTLRENFGEVFQRGKDSSRFYEKSSLAVNRWKRRNMWFIAIFSALFIIFSYGFKYNSNISICLMLTLFFSYYLYKQIALGTRCMSVDTLAKLAFPVLDMGLLMAWYLGAVIGFMSKGKAMQ